MRECRCPSPVPATDPRKLGLCDRCSATLGHWWIGDAQVRGFFDHLGNSLHNTSEFEVFRKHCEQRERQGRERFGAAYLTRDNCVEALEEYADGALYSLLELLRLERDPEHDQGVEADLLDAAWHSAMAHFATRRAMARKRGTP